MPSSSKFGLLALAKTSFDIERKEITQSNHEAEKEDDERSQMSILSYGVKFISKCCFIWKASSISNKALLVFDKKNYFRRICNYMAQHPYTNFFKFTILHT